MFRSNRRLGLTSRKHRKRYREVLSVLTRYGLDELLLSDRAQKLPLIKSIKDNDEEKFVKDLSAPVRLRLALEELDGAFIKIAQILSNRPDIVPKEYIIELEKLQDTVPPFDSDILVDIIESELDEPLYNLFMMFDTTPLASGSIAQVHRAVHFDGTPLVVKVRRPGIVEKFQIDLDILNYIARQSKRIKFLRSQFKSSNPIEELSKEVFNELDLENELNNIIIFQKKMKDNNVIYTPDPFVSYSTEKILTMEYIEGIKVTDIPKLLSKGHSTKEISDKLIEAGLYQIFDRRFFHGDPHPGNIIVLDDGRIAFIDFGLMGRLSKKQRENLIDVISAFSRNDYRKLTKIVIKYAPRDLDIDEDSLESEVSMLLEKYNDLELSQIDVGEALWDVVEFLLKYKITLNFNSYLLIKAVTSYEGIGKKIYPKFELSPHANSFSKKILREKLSPKKIASDLYVSTSDVVQLFNALPNEVLELLNILQGGRLRVNASVIGLEDIIDQIFSKVNKIVNRLIVTIFLAALLLSSSLILKQTNTFSEGLLPLVAGIGFILAMVISFVLLISIIRNRGI